MAIKSHQSLDLLDSAWSETSLLAFAFRKGYHSQDPKEIALLFAFGRETRKHVDMTNWAQYQPPCFFKV